MLPAVVLMTACGSQGNKSGDESSQLSDAKTAVCAPIEGQWLLEHVVVSDSSEIRPADIDPDAELLAFFYNDSTFSFQTGCNTIGGRYVQNNDSIVFTDMLWTEMACEDMRVEELLRTVLPEVNTVDCINDSVVRLNAPADAYVVLKKGGTKTESTEAPTVIRQ